MAILRFAIWRPSAMLTFRNFDFVSRDLYFPVQNFTDIGQLADELWTKKIFKMAAVRHLEF